MAVKPGVTVTTTLGGVAPLPWMVVVPATGPVTVTGTTVSITSPFGSVVVPATGPVTTEVVPGAMVTITLPGFPLIGEIVEVPAIGPVTVVGTTVMTMPFEPEDVPATGPVTSEVGTGAAVTMTLAPFVPLPRIVEVPATGPVTVTGTTVTIIPFGPEEVPATGPVTMEVEAVVAVAVLELLVLLTGVLICRVDRSAGRLPCIKVVPISSWNVPSARGATWTTE